MRGPILLLTASLAAFAQPAPKLEVVSVKLHEGPIQNLGVTTSGLRMTTTSTVLGMVMFAYQIKNDQMSRQGTELAKVGDTFYDVSAKAEGDGPPTRDQFRLLMQTVLAERFQLKLHHEPQEMPVYALTVAKNGPKLKASAADAAGGWRSHVNGRNYEWTAATATIAELVDMIENQGFLDHPVLDKTGLDGSYLIHLTYTPDIRSNHTEPDPNDIDIFQALQNQLGLKLEQQKAPIEVYFVDHVEKPSGN